MLATQEEYRGRGIATQLVRLAIDAMTARDADEIVLETEVSNTASLKLLILYLKEGTALKRPEHAGHGEMGGMSDMRRMDDAELYS
ncbi:unnamed protein product [Alternaria alternata]